MRHPVKLNEADRISAWLDLCDFTFRLMKSSLGKRDLERRLKQMRQAQERSRRTLLSNLRRAER